MDIIVASHNQHKCREIAEIFWDMPEIGIRSLTDVGMLDEIDETGTTFSENAVLKAQVILKWTRQRNDLKHCCILSDDSGLEVKALNGAPGIYSARYAGQDKSSEALCRKLISEMKHQELRDARFVAVMALLSPESPDVKLFEGTVEGIILPEMKGSLGFGYDPVFFYPPAQKTMAEMLPEEKNTISHRAAALEKVKQYLSNRNKRD